MSKRREFLAILAAMGIGAVSMVLTAVPAYAQTVKEIENGSSYENLDPISLEEGEKVTYTGSFDLAEESGANDQDVIFLSVDRPGIVSIHAKTTNTTTAKGDEVKISLRAEGEEDDPVLKKYMVLGGEETFPVHSYGYCDGSNGYGQMDYFLDEGVYYLQLDSEKERDYTLEFQFREYVISGYLEEFVYEESAPICVPGEALSGAFNGKIYDAGGLNVYGENEVFENVFYVYVPEDGIYKETLKVNNNISVKCGYAGTGEEVPDQITFQEKVYKDYSFLSESAMQNTFVSGVDISRADQFTTYTREVELKTGLYQYRMTQPEVGYTDLSSVCYSLDLENMTVEQEEQELKASATVFNKTYGDAAFKLGVTSNASDASIKYSSNNTSVAKVNSSGKVTVVNPGRAVITVTAAETEEYTAATLKITVNVAPAAVKGLKESSASDSAITLSWKKVTGASGYEIYRDKKLIKDITKGSTVSYKNTKLSAAKTYTYYVRSYVKVGEKKIYGAKSGNVVMATAPAKVTMKSVTPGSKSLKVTWKTTSGTGYEIQYSTSSKFKKAVTVKVKKSSSKNVTIKKLSGKTKYYVRVRAYKTNGSATYYGSWSSVKTGVTKK
ncbi:MAG: fibronectin type III domain-containing protein [Clostridiales bacterium]|nr:fibronectin type III domain-containing protein [Clostridiales bacterium]